MIEIKNLVKKFNNKIILNDISCIFEDKKISVIIGPSGSGKTTLLKCITSLEEPTSGEIYISGIKLNKKNSNNLISNLGMVFQHFNLFPNMTVLENLIYSPVKTLSLSKNLAIDKAKDILNKLSISLKINEMPHNLSGGQKQRVAIARALMMDPKFIFFDEPTSALDSESIRDFIGIVSDLRENLTIIIVTHHFKLATKVADRILFMDQGFLLANQEVDDFINNPSSHRVRLFLETVVI